jgi:hypothetical protein
MSADLVHPHGRNIHGKIITEIKKFLGMAVYLWVMFGLMALHTSVVLAERHLSYRFYGFAIVNSLILGKIMLIADDLHLGENFEERPLVYPILFKALLFAIVFICFDLAEEVLVGLVRGKTFDQSIPDIGGGSLRGVLFVAVILSVGLIPFFAFRELSRVLGKSQLRALLFTSVGPAGPGQSRVQSLGKS